MLDHKYGVELYNRVNEVFRRFPEAAVDIQTELVELLQFFQAIAGAKPSFFAFATADVPGRDLLTRDLLRVAATADCFSGIGEVSVHHPYRALKIDNPEIEQVVASRLVTPTATLWVTRAPELAEAYTSGNPAPLGYTTLLGYPRCCATWHYDCYFARGTEAFCDVYLKQMSPAEICEFLRDGWEPTSGWFLPQAFYLAGVLRGNQTFPYIDHVACPTCLRDTASPSANMNAVNQALGERLDPQRSQAVSAWARNLDHRIQDLIRVPRRRIEESMDQIELNVRAKDTYVKHSRYLFRHLGL